MNLKELVLFNPKSKSALIRELKERNISWHYKKNNIVLDNLSLDDFKITKAVYIIWGSTVSILQLTFDKAIYSPLEIKESINNIFGTPKSDNTKHNLDFIRTHWESDSKKIYLSDYEQKDSAMLSVTMPYNDSTSKVELNLLIWLLSLGGGFAWGILFYLFFGFTAGHTKNLFRLSMIGGLVMGFVMAIIFCLIYNFSPIFVGNGKNNGVTKRNKRCIEKQLKKKLIESDGFYCIVYRVKNGRLSMLKSKISINDSDLNIYYLDKGQLHVDKIEINGIAKCYSYTEKSAYVTMKDDTVISFLGEEDISPFFDTIKDSLGYNSERFIKFKDVIFDCMVKFDPNDLIAGGESGEIHSYFSYIFAIEFFDMKSITENDIYVALKKYYDDSDADFYDLFLLHDKTIRQLAVKIYAELDKQGLLENK